MRVRFHEWSGQAILEQVPPRSDVQGTHVSWGAANARRLSRHGLLPESRLGDAPKAVAAMAGAHAQVQSAAEHSVALRQSHATRADVQRSLWIEHALTRMPGVRGTVHLVRTVDLALWTGALGAVPSQSPFPANVRLTRDQTDEIVSAVQDALTDAELTLEELDREVVRRTGSWAEDRVMPAFQDLWPRWRQAMDAAAHRGVLCFGPPKGRRVTYTSPRRWLPGLVPVTAHEAVGWLLGHYLHAFGPATPQQFARWVGASAGWGVEQFRAHRAGLDEVIFDGTPAFVRGGDTQFEEKAPTGAILLPYFDSFVVGSHPRTCLYPGGAADRALTPTGQAGNFPVLLLDGAVAGVWHQRRQGRRMTIAVEPLAPVSRRHRLALNEEVERLGAILDGNPTLVIGPVAIGPHA